jgi:GntR family transcriptional regulator
MADLLSEHSSSTVERLIAHLRERALGSLDDPTALYRRLADAIREAIEQRVVAPGSALPGEREMAQRLTLSRATIRSAIELLVSDRVLVRRQGARTSVARPVVKPLASLNGFSEDMRARGFEPGGIWLKREVAAATPAEAMALGLAAGQDICRMVRLRTADGTPLAVERVAVPRTFLPSPDLVEESLYALLDRLGCMPQRALQRIRAASATARDASLLDVERGAPLLLVERRCALADGRIVEFTESRYRGDSYDFIVETSRTG